MTALASLLRAAGYPHRQRIVPPAEPPALPVVALPEDPFRRCRSCEVQWRGGPACWCCGKAGR